MRPRSVRTALAFLVPVALLLTPCPPLSAHAIGSGRDPAWSTGLLVAPGARGVPMVPSSLLELTVILEPAELTALLALDGDLANPTSPRFDHFLTEADFAARFDPPASNVSAVSGYFTGYGAGPVTVGPDRMSIRFPIRAADASAALSSALVSVSGPSGSTIRALARTPSLPAPISPMIAGISGLTGVVAGAPRPEGGSFAPVGGEGAQYLSGTGPAAGAQWFVGSDYASLYDETPEFPGNPRSAPNASYASSEAIATLLESGYNASTRTNLPPWNPAVVEGYLNETAGPGWPSPLFLGVPVPIDQVTPPPPGPTGNLRDDSGFPLENALDLELAASLAPGVEVANFYFAASLQFGAATGASGNAIADDVSTALGQALAYNYSPRHLAAVSVSFGAVGINDTLWDQELLHAAAIGVSIVASSGDAGNAPKTASKEFLGEGLSWPACSAFDGSGVIAVGGTTLTSLGTPTGSFDGGAAPPLAYDPNTGAIGRSVAWFDGGAGPGNDSGSQGGGAANYSEPSWQFDSAAQPPIASAEHLEGDPALVRAGPDVAFSGNDTLAAVGTNSTGALTIAPLAGTSIAAPLFAGILAEGAAVRGAPFGFLDPALYRIGSYFADHPGTGDPFLDVQSGGNYRFRAGPGWDAVTGWGGIDAALFLPAYANASIVGYVYTGPTPGLPPPAGPGFSVTLLGAGLVLVAGTLLVLAGVLWARTDRRRISLSRASAAPIAPGAPQFDCPYCGKRRPAEAVRCPQCGKL